MLKTGRRSIGRWSLTAVCDVVYQESAEPTSRYPSHCIPKVIEVISYEYQHFRVVSFIISQIVAHTTMLSRMDPSDCPYWLLMHVTPTLG